MSHPLVLALFDDPTAAAAAARDLRGLGVSQQRVSIVARSHVEEGELARAADASPGSEIEDSRQASRLGELSAHLLEASAEDIDYADGRFFVKGSPDRFKTIQDIALMANASAAPPTAVVRLPYVPHPIGVLSVSPCTTFTSFTSTPSSSATICAKVVSSP